MDSTKNRNIVISLDLSRASRRDILTGIFDAINRLGDWNVSIIQSRRELSPSAVRRWKRQGVDGVILAEEGLPSAAAELLASDIPAVIIGAHGTWLRQRRKAISFVRIDDLAIGQLAARELLKLGSFASAAYVPSDDDGIWSRLRGRGFATTIGKHRRIPLSVYSAEKDGPLSNFLRRLKKPAAVFAACDRVIFAELGTRPPAACGIPERTVVLGVDDDPLICDSMRPRLSSIKPDHYGLGLVAARELDALMSKLRPGNPRKRLCAKATLVTRETTVPVAPAASLVQRAVEYIRRNACSGIKCDNVAAALNVSRRLLDLRFRQYASRTVADEILETKLATVKEALASSNDSLTAIAANCGFCNRNHLKNVFKAKTGISMSEWRNSHGHRSGVTTSSAGKSPVTTAERTL